MNDRYLYRAKRKSDKKWIYGNLIQTDDGVYIIQNYVPQHLIGKYEVDPSTICQCTGLKDKNGKLIWENDIMVAHIDDVFPEDETYTKVLWHNNGFCTNENHSIDIEPIDEFDKIHFEVCGNIFDNPELLEK